MDQLGTPSDNELSADNDRNKIIKNEREKIQKHQKTQKDKNNNQLISIKGISENKKAQKENSISSPTLEMKTKLVKVCAIAPFERRKNKKQKKKYALLAFNGKVVKKSQC